MAEETKERVYAVRASGHGLGYQPQNPRRFDMTLAEAEAEVRRWRILADTIGGDAIVVRVPESEG
jgi:hypothetical protein